MYFIPTPLTFWLARVYTSTDPCVNIQLMIRLICTDRNIHTQLSNLSPLVRAKVAKQSKIVLVLCHEISGNARKVKCDYSGFE